MTPVTASTNIDKSKINLAWLDSGAKIFGILADGPVGAEAAAAATDQKTNATV
jgi:hypothetical protein